MIKFIKRKTVKVVKGIDPMFIYDLVKSTPNDMELGEKVRLYIYELEKTR